MPKIGLALAAVGGLFGFGSYLKTPEKPPALANNQFTASVSNKTQSVKNEQNTNVQNLPIKPTAQTNDGLQNHPNAGLLQKPEQQQIQPENPQIVESEPVYFCGAQTKKGTPCTRKVKGGGRCWQHTGLPAILSKEKLVSNQ